MAADVGSEAGPLALARVPAHRKRRLETPEQPAQKPTINLKGSVMRLLSGGKAFVAVAVVLAACVLTGERAAAAVAAGFAAIPGSFKPASDVDMGRFSSTKMTIEVVLAPRNESQLSDLLAKLYDSNSASYRQWLAKGEFYARFGPSDAQIAAVEAHLQASGLLVEKSSSPFLVRADRAPW
jgi:Pro-kumamolisin, activation domain